ncbi:MAG: hypothetical protein MRY83_13425 [Flavobacteriales bacterium]|nr:hypothetical protein [Flavobacteriales bacterium]
MYKLLLATLFFTSSAFCQIQITWETLSDVTFEDRYSEREDANFYYPTFGASVKALEGKELCLEGYILAIDPTDNYYILSRHPYASCFFCKAGGGPDSVVELKLKSDNISFKMDELTSIKGRLKLNQDDLYQCNFIFEEADRCDP